MTRLWLTAMLRRRAAQLLAVAAGVTVAVALLAALGSFVTAAKATMTARATRTVAVDWQVETQPGADPAAVLAASAAAPGVVTALPVGFATLPSLSAKDGTATQTTGQAIVLGLPDGYRDAFPGELRTLAGADTGVLVAQQTAANLHAVPGSLVTLTRPGLPPRAERIAGIVELPQANSLFQEVGAPPQSQPAAPPDNVILLPNAEYHSVIDPLQATHPELITTQVHVSRSHALPADPATAFTTVTASAHNLEATLAGTGRVGDNLGAALDAARADSLYAQVLFLFLGLPAIVLAALLTAAVSAAATGRRRREQALLRTRGASAGQLSRLAVSEAAAIAVLGAAAGLGAALLIGRAAFGTAGFGAGNAAPLWFGAAAAAGFVIAAITVLVPARRDRRASTVTAGRAVVGQVSSPVWLRYGLDLVLLAASALVFRATSGATYALVLAPEGVPSISVSYWAFLGPTLFWIGTGLLTWRLTDLLLSRGRPLVAVLLHPFARQLSNTAAATLSRQRRPIAHAVVLVALAVSFAASTATFNATYRQQAEVDARLTNGADVTVTQPPGARVRPAAAADLATVPGVRTVEPLQHRFAYVGADLQDLYGVRPETVTAATSLQDAYFAGGSAAQLMDTLARQPDAILVSAETVKDYQLRPGDPITLRLPDPRSARPTPVSFHYVGIAKEFPTAPKDSFFIANASYIAAATGNDAVGAFLVNTGGQNTAEVAARIRQKLGPSATVTDLAATRGTVGSSLTSVDLAGLTRVELGFALLLAAAAAGLVLALGLMQRRRMFFLAAALGANRRQLAGFILGEAAIVVAGGLLLGAGAAWGLSEMLVKVLTGVFDPPPAHLAVPWPYLTTVALIAAAGSAAAVAAVIRSTRRPTIASLREG
ncbi:FtsX-like permease family protein [Micromonospora sp. NPDC093277]|uniref:FtsX-like permease family protein n=1 Tax=Micromonospora sp. NPDC093277 TaxID=3364291 RepID=UPI00380AB987